MSDDLADWPEQRPPRTAGERAAIADQYARHLPALPDKFVWSDDDFDAIKAAFIRRFDEALPRTETLMAVAAIGYRIALRDKRRSGPVSAVIDAFTLQGDWNIADLKRFLPFPEKQISNALGYLTRHGKLRRDGYGQYSLPA